MIKKTYKNNPFLTEDLRNVYLKKKELKLLKYTYSKKYPEIKDVNTGKFWNEKFSAPSSFKEQDEMTKEKINTVISFIPKKTIRLLDLGIGQGYIEERLKDLNINYELHGIDISSIAIKKAKDSFNGIFKMENIFQIDKLYKKNYFDTIIALELLEHIPPSKIFTFYKKVHSLLKNKGTFIISVPINEGLRFMKNNPSGHIREYTILILEAEFSLAGFKILEKKTLYAFKNYYRLKNLLIKVLKNRWKPNNVIIKAVKSTPIKI